MTTVTQNWTTPRNSTEEHIQKLPTAQLIAIIIINIGAACFIWILLRLIFKPPTAEEKAEREKLREDEQVPLVTTDETHKGTKSGLRIIHEGECNGNYSEKWTSTFDLDFLIIMIILFLVLCIVTGIQEEQVWRSDVFWYKNIGIFCFSIPVLFCGGLVCRYFCPTDENGYIITNKSSQFKVNYTRKIPLFCTHVVPLLLTLVNKNNSIGSDTLNLSWNYYFTSLSVLILIKPLRERFSFLMIQFNCIDRPEDRPDTLFWLIVCNSIPSQAVTIFFRWLYPFTGLSPYLTNIFVLVNVVGDGLAEPVGVYFGKHRYKTRGCFNKTQYERSFEGSSCVVLSTLVIVSIHWDTFRLFTQFWVAMTVMPLLMAITEATSPHTCDTAFIHFVGGITLFIIAHLNLKWM